jgi:phosphosulfolactate phosphohydrolase-like enzyme
VLAGLTNAVAAAEFVAAAEPQRVRIVCAGDRGEPDLADTIAAGLLVALLDRAARRDANASVSLVGAARYCLSVLRTTKDPLDGIWAAAAAAELRSIGLEEDLAIASEVAVSDVVPRVKARETVLSRPTVRLVAS